MTATTARHDAWSAGRTLQALHGALRRADRRALSRLACGAQGRGVAEYRLRHRRADADHPRARIAALDRGDRSVGGLRRPCARGHVRRARAHALRGGGCAEESRSTTARWTWRPPPSSSTSVTGPACRRCTRDEARDEAGRRALLLRLGLSGRRHRLHDRVLEGRTSALDPKAEELGEGRRFPFCTAQGLTALCAEAGWPAATVAAESRTVARFSSSSRTCGNPSRWGPAPRRAIASACPRTSVRRSGEAEAGRRRRRAGQLPRARVGVKVSNQLIRDQGSGIRGARGPFLIPDA